MRVSVIVVSFNTRDLLCRCLDSLEEADEVIVVDNASTDGSADAVSVFYPHVRLVRNAVNVGFGSANNQGLDLLTGDLALLLNSDAFAEPGAIGLLAKTMADESIVACGGRLVAPAKIGLFRSETARLFVERSSGYRELFQAQADATQNSCAKGLTLWAVFCEQTWLEKLLEAASTTTPYWLTRSLLEFQDFYPNPMYRVYDVAQVMGACLMMRPGLRFDERFFLYCEDTELCHRLLRQGRIVYVPDAVFGHELGASSASARWASVARYNSGKERFFKIHSGAFAADVCWAFDRFGALFRLAVWTVATVVTLGSVAGFRRRVALFARVLFAPFEGPPDPRGTSREGS
ncbi:MAG: glycosyltransferase [Armatimonadetes bacterium]|nr:glycosyltransferase [Armatimonadota bacterium]